MKFIEKRIKWDENKAHMKKINEYCEENNFKIVSHTITLGGIYSFILTSNTSEKRILEDQE